MRLQLVRLLGASAMCLGVMAAPASANTEWIVNRMGGVMRADVTREQVRSQMLAAFYQSNPDERGVTPQGIDDLRKIAAAQRRTQAVTQVLAYDLDGDGAVTKAEIVAVMQPRARQMIHANGVQLEPTAQQVHLQLDRLVSDALKLDTDHDDVISAAEIRQEGQRQADQASASWLQGATQFVPTDARRQWRRRGVSRRITRPRCASNLPRSTRMATAAYRPANSPISASA